MTYLEWPFNVLRHFPEVASHSFKVVSSLADTITELSILQARSEIPAVCPVIDLSSTPSVMSQIFIVLSADADASQPPFGLNFTEETARS